MAILKVSDLIKALELEMLVGNQSDRFEVATSNVNRPGLQLTGYFDYFASDRVQVIGKQEMTYLTEALNQEQRCDALDALMQHPFPCMILSRNMEPPRELLELAARYNHLVFRSKLITNKLMIAAFAYLEVTLAPRITRHGTLLDIAGVGVMITGESGIGKSETALELLHRGHRLVADDVVDICRITRDQLLGSSPENVRHFMEVRGIGIIDVRQMFGIGSVMMQKSIDMVAELELWDNTKQYDRLGLEDITEELLDVKVPKVVLPVMPGRNLAIVMEVAARNHRLKNMGYNSALELHRRINERIGGLGGV